MSLKSVTFEADEQSLATLDEIAANLGADRSTALREALAMYLADYEDLKLELEEGLRQSEAGETLSHEEVMAKYDSWKTAAKTREAA